MVGLFAASSKGQEEHQTIHIEAGELIANIVVHAVSQLTSYVNFCLMKNALR